MTEDGRNVTLTEPLKTDYVGEIVRIAATASTNATFIDLRAVVANNRRNARIVGADTQKYDRGSGLTAQQQGYGAQIRGMPKRVASKPG